MKKLTITAFLAVAGIASAGSAVAQLRHEVRAYVPFEFSVGSKVLPAGQYRFDPESSQSSAYGVLIQNVDQPQYSILVRGTGGPWEALPIYTADRSRLVFDVYEGEHFLREMRGPLNAVNVEIPLSSAEKGVRRSMAVSQLTQTTVDAGQ
jgi:hypothetical protein